MKQGRMGCDTLSVNTSIFCMKTNLRTNANLSVYSDIVTLSTNFDPKLNIGSLERESELIK